jgi:PGF-CTERM protein
MAALPTRSVVFTVSTVLVGLLLVGGGGFVSDDGTAAAVHENSDSPEWVHEANFTLQFTNPEPGEQTGALLWASLPQSDHYGDGLEEGKFVELWLPESFSGASSGGPSCTRENVAVAGIDHGANNSGARVDMSLVSNVKNYGIDQNAAGQTHAIVEAYGRNDFGGDFVAAHYSDEAVVKIEDCLVTPEEPGWYRAGFYANGTNYEKEYVGAAGYTSYVPICDCEDREDAIETLGAPPSEGTGTDGTIIRADSDGVYGDTLDGGPPSSWDLEAKRDPSASEDQGSDSGSDGDSDDGSDSAGGGSEEPTATEAPSSDGGGDGSDGGQSDDPASTEAPNADGGDDGSNAGGGSGAADGDGGADDGGDGGSASSGDGGGSGGQATPTPGEGPGFGPLVALVGFLAAALLASRRN